MSDEIIEELWRTKDSIAREHNHDVGRLTEYLQGRTRAVRDRNVDGHSVNETAEADKSVESAIEGRFPVLPPP